MTEINNETYKRIVFQVVNQVNTQVLRKNTYVKQKNQS